MLSLSSAAAGEQDTDVPLPCTSVLEEMNFPHYWVGAEFDGLELTDVVWECREKASGKPGGNLTYIYGDCNIFDACTFDVQIHNLPAQAAPKGKIDLPGEDMTLGGVSVTRYQGFVEIYRPETTIHISGGDGHRKARLIGALQEGPRVLATLAGHGLYFDSECLHDHYCHADRSISSRKADFYRGIFITWGIPFLVALLAGWRWLLLFPVVAWPIHFFGLEQGWWGFGLGESGYFPLLVVIPLAVADVGAGLGLRWLILQIVRSRPSKAPA
jgi:hypothetical protein